MLTKALRIATTYRCPLDCPVCYAESAELDMEEDTFRFLLEEGKGLGFESVALGGGEPLVNRGQLQRFLELSKGAGYLTAVTTSGFNLTESYLEKLTEMGLDHLQLSLGYNRRCFPEKLELLNGTGRVQWGVNFLVDPRRLDELPAIQAALAGTDCEYIVYLVPRVGEEHRELRFTYAQVLEYMMLLSHLKGRSEKLFFVGCATNFLRAQVCAGLRRGVSISADGKLSMCGYCDRWVEVGDSLEAAIAEFNRKHFTGKCEILEQYIWSGGDRRGVP